MHSESYIYVHRLTIKVLNLKNIFRLDSFTKPPLCSSGKYLYPPLTEGTFALDPDPGISVPPSHPIPGTSRNFSTWLGTPLERLFASKMLLHYIIMRKIIFSAIK